MWQQLNLLGEGQEGRTHAPWESLRAAAGLSFSHPWADCRERRSGGHRLGKQHQHPAWAEHQLQPQPQLGTCSCTAG